MVRHISDDTAVMYLGKEKAEISELFETPNIHIHYLLAAAPEVTLTLNKVVPKLLCQAKL